jgi:predicted ATPase/class 3 adenylate cyclase
MGHPVYRRVVHLTQPDLATGTLAFLFTDIAGSTQLWERMPEAMGRALARHDAILRTAIEAARGQIVKTTGDGLMAVFPTVGDAVAACLEAQRALAAEPWGETGSLRVRMGVHAGRAERRGDDFFGPTVNRTARLMAAGHGGQVLLSAAAADLTGDPPADGAALRDLGEYRLKDLGRPERVFQLVHPDLADAFPPLTTLDHAAGRLPEPAAPFVGRRDELAEIEGRIGDPAVRLLTLTGPGGTGKTSLAIRAAGKVSARFRDGVSFVDLSAARDTEALLVALGRVIGVGEAPERSLLADVTDRLRDRQVLLVLDNFEQVTAAAGVVTDLLDGCPALTLLVTSREQLHVRAEHVHPVPPMALPPAGHRLPPLEALRRIEAIELFVDRARAVRAEFELTDDNAAAVVDICRRLDGLPLAIELAAARLRLFSPEALRDRLRDRLDLLRSSARDLPERQHTLRATIDWSYQLLEPGEQRLFETLAVFSDADLPAVEAVAEAVEPEDGTGTGADVIDGLGSLLEKSLVREVEATHGEPRFLMLGTIREYAADRLDERSDGGRVRRAHATHYAALAERLRRDLGGPRRDQVVETLAHDAGNLKIAWRYWIAERDLDQLTRLADSLLILNEARGWYRDTVELTTGLLKVLAERDATPEIATKEFSLRISLARALMATRGFTPEVEEAFAHALERAGPERELRQEFTVLRSVANLHLLRAEFDQGIELGGRLLEIGEAEGDVNMRIDALLVQATGHVFTGGLRDGLARLDEAIELFDASPARAVGVRLGNEPRVACLTTSGFCLWLLGCPDRAVERANAGIELARRLDHPWTLAFAHFHSGLLHLWRREDSLVHDRASRLLEIADEYDFRIWSAIGSCLSGAAQARLGNGPAGLALVAQGMAAYQGLVSPPVFLPMLQFVAAGTQGRAGRPAEGLETIRTAIDMMGGAGSPSVLFPELGLLQGDLLEAIEGVDAAAATDAWGRALAASRRLETRMSELRALTRLCRAGPIDERAARAAELASVLTTFTEGEDTEDLRDARAALAGVGRPVSR